MTHLATTSEQAQLAASTPERRPAEQEGRRRKQGSGDILGSRQRVQSITTNQKYATPSST